MASPLSLTQSQPQHWSKAQHLQIIIWSTTTATVMNVGICVCVLLAALSSGSLSLASPSMKAEGKALVTDSLPPPSPNRTRLARSAPASPSGHLSNYNQPQEDAPNSLSQLLARLINRKGSPYQTRSSLTSRASGVVVPGHRIKDRDYLGWMDFGRRSAEEYEYSA
ncbi:cholecystokinin-like [Mugil cephalus]|uniref:cholecystokinin-like n=1 Tax=Mugil cephalus TaxID=48193 RepID=UPI001FB5B3E1|nr:cholecystokinin-like [Mugil cephalus]